MKIKDRSDEIIKMYESGLSYYKISTIIGCSTSRIQQLINKSNIKIRTPTDYRKYKINEKFFDEIDSEEKAYFLGILFADGYNSTDNMEIVISLQENDVDILYKLKNIIGYTGDLKFVKKAKPKHKDQMALRICSKYMSVRLSELGCIQNKSLVLEYPNYLCEDLHRHFIRGYFDGDGCITESCDNAKFILTGTNNFLKKAQDILIDNCNLSRTKFDPIKNSVATSLRYGGYDQLNRIFDWLYNDSKVHMDRKYNKFKEVMITTKRKSKKYKIYLKK